MSTLAVTIRLEGRTFLLVVDATGGVTDVAWYEGRSLLQRATQFESALGMALIKARGTLARLNCEKLSIRDCFDCESVECEFYFGPVSFKPLSVEDEPMVAKTKKAPVKEAPLAKRKTAKATAKMKPKAKGKGKKGC